MHHQYAIALRTPKYRNPDITEPVEVFIELFRPSDQDRSEEMPFKYKPRSYLTPRKKPRMASSSSSSTEIPTVIRAMHNNYNQTPMSSDSISDGLNSDELRRFVNEADPANLKPISVESNEFESFFQAYNDQWQKQHQIIEPLQADGVIQRGPNAPPMIIRTQNQLSQKKSDPNSIMREIASTVSNKNMDYTTMREHVLNAIKENITERGEKYVHK